MSVIKMNHRSLFIRMTGMTMTGSSSIIEAEDASRTTGARRIVRLFVLFEAATFIVAALVHFGVLPIGGYQHRAAGIGESVIAAVLLTGFAATWIRPTWSRGIGLVAQTFALLGTLVGIFTIVIGVGPRTVPDIAYHVGIVIVLLGGLLVVRRISARSGHHA